MKTWIAVPLLVALPALPLPWEGEPPEWLLPWLYNARERTQQSREAYDEGRFQEAVEAAETAHRLAPEDPRTELNLGTSLLAANQAGEALEPLTRAAERLEAHLADAADPPGDDDLRLASTAHYNRGNALLDTRDLPGAIEAYEQALRRNPEHLDAKHNLEVALEQLRQQQQQQQQQQQGQEGGPGDESQQTPPSEGSQGEDENQQQPPQPEGEQDTGQEPQPTGASEDTPPQQGDPRLPRFEDQPDMSAQEAAAILEAVENLEREQRRLDAAQRAREKARGEKDW